MAFGDKTPSASDVATIVASGGGQGLPIRGPGFQGAAGQANDAMLGTAVLAYSKAITGAGQETIELGITASGTVATPVAQLGAETLRNVVFGVGIAKLAFDLGTVGYGYLFACK